MILFSNQLKSIPQSNIRETMKHQKKPMCILLITILLIALFTGCRNNTATDTTFSLSDGIDENGYWTDIRALDYIELFDYQGMVIPNEIHQMSYDEIQAEIAYILADYTSTEHVTDRAVVDGDTVNIDYVGSVDGVEFDGGSTGGAGTDVTAGSTDYIDDFLIQIIGHTPEETINVEVTFPDDYHESSLQGKDAVFVTTINYIVDTVSPELTDEFVTTSLYDYYGWTSIAEMEEEIQNNFRSSMLEEYIMDYLTHEVTVSSIPEKIADYQTNSLKQYYQGYADEYEMDLDTFLSSYVGVSSMDELLESSQEDNYNNSRYSLAIQAIAEDAGITADIEDVVHFFTEHMGTSDYSTYEEQYGLPYLIQVALQHKIVEFIIENAVLS